MGRARKYTQRKLADELGVSARSIARWTNGSAAANGEWPRGFPLPSGLRSAGGGKVWVSQAELDALYQWSEERLARRKKKAIQKLTGYYSYRAGRWRRDRWRMDLERVEHALAQVQAYLIERPCPALSADGFASLAADFTQWVRPRWTEGRRPNKAILGSLFRDYCLRVP
jgi:transcriptional regulator with XRE-family HTH domain